MASGTHGTLRVDITELTKLASGLGRAKDQILYQIGSNLTSGEIGHPKVAAAMDTFYTNWDYRRREIATGLGTLGQMLWKAAEAYRKTEDGIVEACSIDWGGAQANSSGARTNPSSGGSTGGGSSGGGAGGGGGGWGASGAGGDGGATNAEQGLRRPVGDDASPYERGDAEWDAMTSEERRQFLESRDLEEVGNNDANPPHMRYAANYARVEQEIAYLEAKDHLTDAEERRLASYRGLVDSDPPRQILYFDPSGDGKIAVVSGELSTADNVAVKVPGISNDMNNVNGPIEEGDRLQAQAGPGTAVVTWLYDAPVAATDVLNAGQILTPDMAERAAPELCNFMRGLQAGLGDKPDFTVIGHSYGSLVVGLAAKQGLNVDNVIFIGSPGVGVDSVADFNLPPGTRIFAAEPEPIAITDDVGFGGDPVSNISRTIRPFGSLPTDADFGAMILDIGTNGNVVTAHSDYYDEGSRSLAQLSSVVTDNRPL